MKTKILSMVLLAALAFGALANVETVSASDKGTSVEAAMPDQWTWVDGSNSVDQGGTYGTEDTPATETARIPRWLPYFLVLVIAFQRVRWLRYALLLALVLLLYRCMGD